jgi:hypothetical protein
MVLHAAGRSDVTGKIHLAETPAYLALLYWMVREFGISGAALAWTMRAGIDALLIFAAGYLSGVSTVRCLRLELAFFSCGAFLLGIVLLKQNTVWQFVAAAVLMSAYVVFVRILGRNVQRDVGPRTAAADL